MADTKPPADSAGAASNAAKSTPSAAAAADAAPKPPTKPSGNPALRMMGIPNLPKKLPSRNWMIFWALTSGLSAAIIYDKREKKRATAKWARVVAPLADQPLRNPNELPRKITVFLESPPGDGLRIAQDHFIEYVRPVLAASGLDWEFVQGRQQGDVRAAVAEKIRRSRKEVERPDEEVLATNDKAILESRQRSGIREYDGIKGDLVLGRHTWKEYIRGLHEGWLGPLDPPVLPEPPKALEADAAPQEAKDGADSAKEEPAKQEEADEKKPDRPPQPPSYNSTADYSSASLPHQIPAEFNPSTPIEFPHVLGFSATWTRFMWFLNRRKLADSTGREVAAICFAAARDWDNGSEEYPQTKALEKEEKYWPKSVFKTAEEEKKEAEKNGEELPAGPPKEKIWPVPVVADPRIVSRMRRFELLPEHEQLAKEVVVPEAEIEGWIKGSLRQLYGWGVEQIGGKKWSPNVGDISNESD
ncbi:probable TIM54 (component of the mitochondrial TIM22 translocase) [Cephalotrichum gorgonifer]|uniref:Mitochondrial import inner membrane translocase subunit TIM54 n=1 Tax=Cephalotrichum gorgonifer TaxID=2041049 RepID=A0AAE8MPW8_9PEZI|nr:probable TIM54 (component of the mitochondrial TIM22 translocase) [Cephalotrichum gorgonifer]